MTSSRDLPPQQNPRLDRLAAADATARIYCDYLEKLEGSGDLRVEPGVAYDDIDGFFADTLGETGIGVRAAVDEFEREIIPRSMATPHPMYMGLVNCSPLPAAPLADLLVSTINNNGGARHQSPAAYGAERELTRAFSRLCYGDPGLASGLLLPGGGYANLQGLLVARQRHFPGWREHGPAALDGAPRMYCGSGSHFSVARSAEVAGLGRSGVREVAVLGRGAIDLKALERQIISDKSAGHRPFLVVATAGSTGTGAIDPLAGIADLCAAQDLWLHVDACYGGAACLLDPPLAALSGIERADSIAVDPHKWFFMPVTSAMFLCRHPGAETETFGFDASYIPNARPEDAYRRSIPSSRRASALTVWMSLRAHGWASLRTAVANNIALARRIEHAFAARGFRVLPDGELSIANIRWQPDDLEPAQIDALQIKIAHACVATGQVWFATAQHAGETWLRFNPVNLHVREHHVDQLIELVTSVTRQQLCV